MKKQSKKHQNKKTNSGITLIALVITIVILLILAMVSIRLVLNGGIITHAEDATSKYKVEEEKEKISLGYSHYQMSKYTGETAVLSVDGATVTGDEASGWNVKFSDTGNEYKISSTGDIKPPKHQ